MIYCLTQQDEDANGVTNFCHLAVIVEHAQPKPVDQASPAYPIAVTVKSPGAGDEDLMPPGRRQPGQRSISTVLLNLVKI